MSAKQPQKPSTCRNATDHGKNALEFRHEMPNTWGLDGSEKLHAMEKETSHDEIDTCEKYSLVKDSISLRLVPPPHASTISAKFYQMAYLSHLWPFMHYAVSPSAM